uniref:Hemimethylated DNA-binding domain-containing protein n=2 Tax=Odontella aurita TaxID=265563 RepID=A0A7S4MNA2_9STRA|mmetsp:Transcript_26855/g.79378  ORF Transcript_26855/g.79378 Transcript_26855/m.79378 type:complete len:861 (+) Transcript_26855:33-2615(+)
MIAFSGSARLFARRYRPSSLGHDSTCSLGSLSSITRGAGAVGRFEIRALDPLFFPSDDANTKHAKKAFSTCSGGTRSPPSDSRSILARTVYRQLLRWCDAMGGDAPLDPVPPVTLAPPRVDGGALQKLAAARVSGAGHWYDGGSDDASSSSSEEDFGSGIENLALTIPKGSIVDEGMITMPAGSVSDVRSVIRVAYRLNAAGVVPDDDQTVRDRVDLAFEALKSLNELSLAIEDRRASRERNRDREGVQYHVGQVLRHKGDRWRGVVCGWRRKRPSDVAVSPVATSTTKEGQSTSLTQKDYSAFVEPESEEVFYDFVLDQGDAHMLSGRRSLMDEMSPFPMVAQSDVEPVAEPALRRIRSNWTASRFHRFDADKGHFVPNDTLAYEYPLDGAEHLDHTLRENLSSTDTSTDIDIVNVSQSVIQGVKDFCARLERCILDVTSCPDARNLGILEEFRKQLSALSLGDVENAHEQLTSPSSGSRVTNAARHLRPLLRLTLELSEMLWQRRASSEHKSAIAFPLGSIVQHRTYGYRGVVVAWDPRPAVDVSQWDGLRHVENPQDKPFYHVIPDRNDSVRAFGGERPFRYVCEDNLEVCPQNGRLLEVDMEPGWERVMEGDAVAGVASAGGAGGWRYEPPEVVKFKYAEDLGDDEEILIESMMRMKENITKFFLEVRGESCDGASICAQGRNMSMENLLALLRASDNIDDAVEIEETIKEVWKAHASYDMRCRLDSGVAELLRGNKETSLSIFEELVTDDPTYFEAWNKKSTCHFMVGEMEKSMESARKAVDLCPQHFQAMNGLGLVQYETRRYRLAAESFRQSIGLDPWSPVSSRLAACSDLLKDMDIDVGEEGAEEVSAPYEK